ncbi:MAG TPA: hypothetical protein VGV07_18365 [Devosia sp.]|nr:hypothetical protein [Devosia sp.]
MISTAESFALMLETACRDFEVLVALVSGRTQIVAADGPAYQAQAAVTMALAKSFVFHAVRAVRICEHGASQLAIDRQQRRTFLSSMRRLVEVRDVNEHGFDAVRVKSRPKQHLHEDHNGSLDETSMVILGPEQILMGPLNLWGFYRAVGEMRDVAGFRSLPLPGPAISLT